MRVRFLRRRNMPSAFQDHGRAIVDAVVLTAGVIVVYLVIRNWNLYETLTTFVEANEDIQLDEVVIVVLLSVVGLLIFGARRLQDQRREIRARQKAEDRVRFLAMADTLTGLPNRRRFEVNLGEILAGLTRTENRFALMMIDLDRFKPINDVFGHAVGDQVLITFATRARTLLGPGGMLARFGGDEFALLLGPLGDAEEPARLARRLLAAFEQPFDAAGAQVTLGASIGIALLPQDGVTGSELLRKADIALYRAKNGGRQDFRFFEPEMDAQVKKRARLERDLRTAIVAGNVLPFYQPIVNLKTGSVTGFEALARWNHPEFGDVSPTQFIGIAEDSGMITELSAYLLRRAARDATAWPAPLTLSFNLSRMQLADPMVVLRTLQILGETGLSPNRLEIEINEEALVGEIVAARNALDGFRAAGVRIALDDFGTGNSSLRHLRECHFDRLKIDRSFITSMIASEDDTTFVNAVLGLSQALGLSVIAEGIEDEQTIAPLLAAGCLEGQGFRFSEAVSAEAALRLVTEPARQQLAG